MTKPFEITSQLKTTGATQEGVVTPAAAMPQVPPDVKIRIGTELFDILKMAGIGPYSVGRYAADTEYWRWGAEADFRGVTSLQLTAESFRQPASATGAASGAGARAIVAPGGTGEQELDEFFAPFTKELKHPRVIPASDWLEGARAVPSGRTGHLFWAFDPDDVGRKIGLMVEQSAVGTINALVWYKTFRRVDCQIWGSYPSSRALALTRVVDAFGNHSTDPRQITPDVTWYHTVMGPSLSLVAPVVRKPQPLFPPRAAPTNDA